MTDEAVNISITLKVENLLHEIHFDVPMNALEDRIQTMTQGLGPQVLERVIQVVDDRIAAKLPAGWRNVGREGRTLVSSLGPVHYKRRVYQDANRQRWKPVDELLGAPVYSRVSRRVQEIGSALVSNATYRLAVDQLSYLLKTDFSVGAIQRMAWRIGNEIADGEDADDRRTFEEGAVVDPGKITAPVITGESDGVYIHLQREKAHSAEVRVAILSTGRKAVGKDRFRLENKCCITAIGLNSQAWQEKVLRTAHRYFDLEHTQQVICGGDGNQWVRHTFDRMQIPQAFVLDRFHLFRAARRALQDHTAGSALVRRLCKEGFESAAPELRMLIQQSSGQRKEKLQNFYRYIQHNQDGLLDLEQRGLAYSACLGAIEGNVDKLVVHRMKGRGCSWRLCGARAMLAICRHADSLRAHAYRYLPIQPPERKLRKTQLLTVQYAETIQAAVPAFRGPHQNRPWVKSLHQRIYGR